MNNEITPLDEKLNQYERYGDVKEVDQIRICNDVKEAIENFCEEIKNGVFDAIEEFRFSEFMNEAKLKYFGKGLV